MAADLDRLIQVGPYRWRGYIDHPESDFIELGDGGFGEPSDDDAGVVWMLDRDEDGAPVVGLALSGPRHRIRERGEIRIPFLDGETRRLGEVEHLVIERTPEADRPTIRTPA